MPKIKEYEDLKLRQGIISNEDFPVIIADNVLTEEQTKIIYNLIEATQDEDTRLQEFAGHRAWNPQFPKDIEKRIEDVAKMYLGDGVVLTGDYSFARYSPEYGFDCKLFPHFDSRDSQTITFDIQLNATEPWGIVVENETYYLKNNQALVFAGTQQIHWRENKKLSPDAKVDMVFCHLRHSPDKELDSGQLQLLEERSRFLLEHTGISNEAVPYSV